MAEQPTNVSGSNLWALLIGIDEYLRATNLSGCVNDVEAMRVFLMNQLGVPEDHIRVLTNQEASRANILESFQGFLIDNPAIARGDQILFHYSGHGSQMLDPLGVEPDGYNETLVAHDSREGDVYDIPDKTLAVLLDRLAANKGDHITIILDSCHSGSGTRKLEGPGVARTRRLPADDRLPPANLDADLLADASTRDAGPSGWSLEGVPYVLLAGCRDREESNEYWARDEGGQGIWHGALTYFTLRCLEQMAPGTTYVELHERVAAQVNAVYPTQMPQCEGDRDREVFGGARVQRAPFISVQRVEGDTVTLGAGLVHGLRQDTELALYPPEVRTRDDLPPEPLATVIVISVSATTARARVQDARGDIPVHARGIISRQAYVGLRQTVALQATEGEENRQVIERLRQAIQEATPDGEPSPYLEVADDSDQGVDLRVVAADGKLSIYGANGELLAIPEDIQEQGRGDAVAVLHALESIARYRMVQDLTNQESGSQLAGKIKVHLRRYVAGPEGPQIEDLPAGATGPGGELTLSFDPAHREHNHYVVDVVNETSLSVYPHIFTLSPDYSIHRLYPDRGQEDELKPGQTLSSGLASSGGARLEVYLPDEPRWDSSRDFLKVIATTVPSDLGSLEQGGLNVPSPARRAMRAVSSPLDQLLDTVLYSAGTRFMRPAETSAGEDWATVTTPITVVREYQTRALDAPADRVPLGDGLTLVKPDRFQGQVTVTTWGQAARGAEGDPNLKPPPGLERLPDLFQPIGRPGTRSVGPSGLVIAFDVDEASRRSITPENPLRLELPPVVGEEVADLLPVIFDGEDYLLAGYADSPNVVELVTLPPPVVSTDAEGRPTARGIGRTIRLFIYKKVGRYTPLTGLRRGALVNGEAEYSEVQQGQFQPDDRVAVFVHGFASDSRWMIERPAQFLRQAVQAYDHLLTWDYETFGTSIQDNGEQLALALKQQCGFGPDDETTIHVYAHSMGCLVSRCMIELSGGHQFVDRLVMAGPPNRGTTLANLSRGAVYLITALINRYAAIPPIGAVKWTLKQVYQQGAGWADIAVDSPIVEQLNALEEPSNVPYLVLAGENLLDEGEQNRLDRLAHKVLDQSLDAIFGEQNDVAIGVSSMRSVRRGAYPRLKVEELPCDHFHYFATPQGREAVKRWVMG